MVVEKQKNIQKISKKTNSINAELIEERTEKNLDRLKKNIKNKISINGFRNYLIENNGNFKKVEKDLKEEVKELLIKLNEEAGIKINPIINIKNRKIANKFVDDTIFILKIALTIIEDESFEHKYIELLDKSIKKAYNSIINYYEDIKDLSNLEITKQKIQELSKKEIGEELDKIDDNFLQKVIDKILIKNNKGNINDYIILNYPDEGITKLLLTLTIIYISDKKEVFGDVSEKEIFSYLDNYSKLLELTIIPSIKDGKEGLIYYVYKNIKDKDKAKQTKVSEILDKIYQTNSIPKRNMYLIAEKIGSLKELIKDIPELNKDALEQFNENKIDEDLLVNFILKKLKEKKIGLALDVLSSRRYNSTEYLIKRYIEEQQGRTIELGINTNIGKYHSSRDALDLVKKGDINYIFGRFKEKFVNKLLRNAPAATDNEHIYIKPFIDFYNLQELNSIMLFAFIRHEVQHITKGSFEYNVAKETDIDLLEVTSKYWKFKYKEKEIKEVQEYLKEIYDIATSRLKKKKYAKINLSNIFEEYMKAIDEVARKTNNKHIQNIAMLKESLISLSNIFEDYRIDQLYIQGGKEDEDLPHLGDVRDLRKYYKLMMYSLLWRGGLRFKQTLKDANKDANHTLLTLLNMPLYKTKLGKLYERFVRGEGEIHELFEDELERIMNKMFKENENSTNKAIEMSLEYLALVSIFLDKKIKVVENYKSNSKNACNMPNQNNSGQGNEQQNKEGPSQKSVDEDQGTKEQEDEDQSESEKNQKSQEDEDQSESEKGQENANKTEESSSKGNDEKEIIENNERDKIDEERNKINKKGDTKIKEEQKKRNNLKGVNKREVTAKRRQMEINKVLYERYKVLLSTIRTGMFETKTEQGKRGTRLDIDEFVKAVQTGQTNKMFKRTYITTTDKGHYLEKRPIDIYLAIDTSGSMGDISEHSEVTNALQHSLALIAAYKDLHNLMKKENINLRLISVADSESILEVDAKEFRVYKSAKGIAVEYDFEAINGGTDLAGMIRTARTKVQEIREKTVKKLWEKEGAVNPSILFLFFTDFGDNSRNAEGVKQEIKEFADFAKEYREGSRLVNKKMRDVGISVMFIVPDNKDSSNLWLDEKIADEVSKVIDVVYAPPTYKGAEELARIIEKNKLILLGEGEASNVKED